MCAVCVSVGVCVCGCMYVSQSVSEWMSVMCVTLHPSCVCVDARFTDDRSVIVCD